MPLAAVAEDPAPPTVGSELAGGEFPAGGMAPPEAELSAIAGGAAAGGIVDEEEPAGVAADEGGAG